MKLGLTVSILVVCAMTGAEEPKPRSIKALLVDKTSRPVIDGKLSDDCWQQAEGAGGFWSADGSRQMKRSASVRIAHDEEHIYVAFRLPIEDENDYRRAEIYLDPFREHQREFGLSEDLTRKFWFRRDPRIFRFSTDRKNRQASHMVGVPWYAVPWVCVTTASTSEGRNFWTAECSIPMASVAYFEFAKGDEDSWTNTWGINFGHGDTRWIADFDQKKQTIPLRKYNARVDADGYPLKYGLLTGLDFDSTPYRWYYLLDANSGEPKIGPRVIGDVQIVLSMNNFTDKRCKLTVKARAIQEDGTTHGSPYTATSDYDIHAIGKGGVHWGYGSLTLPVTEPGTQTVLLTVVDQETGRELSHRPVLIDPIEVGYGLWDRSFYMTESEARLTLHVDASVKVGASVSCALRRKGEKKLLRSDTVTWAAYDEGEPKVAQTVFPLESLAFGDYVVTCTVAGQEGHPFDVLLRKLPYKPGAVQYTDYGVFLRDGKPFFPTGFFYVKNDLRAKLDFRREYADAGFTSFMLEWMGPAGFIETSRTMSEFDVFPIMGMQKFGYEVTQWDERGDYSWDSLLNGRLPMVRKAVSMVTSKAQENIFAWMTRDEPNENMYNMVKAYHDIIHELDPYHPTWIPFAQSELFPAYRYAVDSPGPYVYPNFPGGDISIAGERTAKAAREMPGQPVVPVIQTFVPIDYAKGKPFEHLRQPNRTELRCMAFHAIVNGASGFTFFSYFHGGPQKEVYPQTWLDVKELVGHLRSLTPVILSPPLKDIGVQTSDGHKRIQARLYRHDGSLYAIAVNHEELELRDVEFALQSSSSVPEVQQARVLFENRKITAKRGLWRDDFDKFGVHIYALDVKK